MFCTSCGTPNLARAAACRRCGARLPGRAAASGRRQRAPRGVASRLAIGGALLALPLVAALVVIVGAGALAPERVAAPRAALSAALARGDYAAALVAYDAGLPDGPTSRALRGALADRDAALAAASRLLARDDPAAAVARLRPVVRALPADPDTEVLLDQARTAAERALENDYRDAVAADDWAAAERALAAEVAHAGADPDLEAELAQFDRERARLTFSLERVLWTSDPAGADLRLLSSEVPVARPVWSPDRGRIAFVSFDPYDGRSAATLYRIDADGGNLTPLYRDAHPNALPSWSPDGRFVALTSVAHWDQRRDEGALAVAVVDAEMGRAREIGPAPDRHASNPAWSPDGRSVAFISRPVVDDPGFDRFDGPAEVMLWSAADGSLRDLSRGTLPDALRIVWLPRGNAMLVVTRPQARSGQTASAPLALVALDPGTGASRLVVDGIEAPTSIWSPSPSPDGSRLAYVDNGDEVVVRDADGREQRLITGSFLSGAIAWSPGGDALIAFAADPRVPSIRVDLLPSPTMTNVRFAYDTQWPTGTPQWSPAPRLARAAPVTIAGVGLDAGAP